MDQTASEAKAASEQRHRLANTLQLLAALARMRGQRCADPESRRHLQWMADAIGTIGALEPKRTGRQVDFAAYLAEMAPVWARRHGSPHAQVRVNAAALQADDQTASTLCMIAQELVCNALTHGLGAERPGCVTIGLALDGDRQCILSVEDDGVGFDPASPAHKDGFGLWLVRSLAAQVRGTFTLTPQPGVRAQLAFLVDARPRGGG